jgi:hypothetical protein
MLRWAGPVAGILLVAAALPSARAQDRARGLPGVAAPRSVVTELQDALGHATERLQARDEAGVLSHVSDRYRSGSLTKPAIREQLHALFGVYDSVRANVQIDEVRAVGEEAWVYSTGEVSGRVRGLGVWMLIFSWKREPEIARREQGVWRLYGDQK